MQFKFTLLTYDEFHTYDNGSNGGFASWEYLWLTDQTPKEVQAVPWTDFLDFACRWGYGQAESIPVARQVTLRFFWTQMMGYNLGTPRIPTRYVDLDLPSGEPFLELNTLITDLSTNPPISGNCVDGSAIVGAALSALGVANDLQQLTHSAGAFITNLVCAIGTDASNVAWYHRLRFMMHQQVLVGGGVYDVVLAHRYDLGGSVYMNPPLGWPMDGYWQTSGGSGVFRGLVYRLFMPGYDTVADFWNAAHTYVIGQEVSPHANYPAANVGATTKFIFDLEHVK